MDRFQTYTVGRNIKVESDHKPLEIIHKKNLTSAPKRSQRMLLRLNFKPGCKMYMADVLRRAFLPEAARSRSKTEIETEQINIVQHLPPSTDSLEELQSARGSCRC